MKRLPNLKTLNKGLLATKLTPEELKEWMAKDAKARAEAEKKLKELL